MKLSVFVIFFSIVISVYGLLNFYIYHRAIQVFPIGTVGRGWFISAFWFFVSAFLLARILERMYPSDFTEVITWIGSVWLGVMVYSLLAVLFIDFTRLLNHYFHIYPSFLTQNPTSTRNYVFLIVSGFVLIISTISFINARIPNIKKMEILVDKKFQSEKSELRIVMASDIHMGTLIGKRRTNYLVKTINRLNPDVILFAGDLVDEDLAPVLRRNLGDHLTTLKAPFGVYAITGNHEYIGGAEPAVKYLSNHGITILRDSAILVDGKFYLVGRDDKDKSRFSGTNRKSLHEIMDGIDHSYPIILLDHQPFKLNQAVEAGVDLQLSGHTHHGQLWPFNYITNAIYEVSHGYKKIGASHFYVSSGFGTWGPPMRLGNRPEIVVITMKFKTN